MERREYPEQFNFITLPSNDFNCPVCLSVLQEPFLTTCCGGHFCEGCVQKVKTQFDECPLCKEKPLNAVIDKYFKRQLDQLMIYCPQKECTWTGELGKVNEHLATDQVAGECQYVTVKCPLSCGLEVLRKLLDSHIAEDCPYRSTSCLYCDFEGSHVEVTTQHIDACPNYPCNCPNSCSPTIIKRHEISDHLAECPEQEIPCAFVEMGCTKVMHRKQLQEHLEMSSIEHQLLTCKAFSSMKLEAQQKIEAAEQKIQAAQEKIEAMQQQHQSEITTIREEMAQVESQAGQAEYWVNGFKLMAEEVKKNDWAVYLSRMSELVSSMSPPIAPIIISLPNITNKLSKGIHTRLIHSTPFYTDSQGYKMLLYAKMVYHDSKCVGSLPNNVVVGLCIVKGEHDRSLEWPFHGEATILLFNSKKDDKHRKVVYDFTATQPLHRVTKPVSTKKSAVISSRKDVRHKPYHFKAAHKKVSETLISFAGPSWSLDHRQCKPVESTNGAKFSYDKKDNCFKGDKLYFKVTVKSIHPLAHSLFSFT